MAWKQKSGGMGWGGSGIKVTLCPQLAHQGARRYQTKRKTDNTDPLGGSL